MQILFINNEALNVLNLKRENTIRRSAQEIAMKNDLLRRLIRGMLDQKEEKEQSSTAKKRTAQNICRQ